MFLRSGWNFVTLLKPLEQWDSVKILYDNYIPTHATLCLKKDFT